MGLPDTPFKTAALTVCALCAYAADKDAGIEMLTFLKGPQPLSPYDLQFLKDRFMDGKWFLWEQMLLADIRKPVASDPWA